MSGARKWKRKSPVCMTITIFCSSNTVMIDVFLSSFTLVLDCEQSLFFFRFSKGSARARERWARTEGEGRNVERDARTEGGSPTRLQSRAWSFTCLGRFARRTEKKEKLLVVYSSFLIEISTIDQTFSPNNSLHSILIRILTRLGGFLAIFLNLVCLIFFVFKPGQESRKICNIDPKAFSSSC